MKNKFNLLLLTTVSVLFSSSLLAEGFNDNYIQLGYTSSDYKHVDKITTVSGSVEFGNNYLLSGSYSYEKGDWNDPGEYETLTTKKTLIGVDKYFPLNSTTDITSSLTFDKWKLTKTCTLTAGTDCSDSYSDGKVSYIDVSTASIGIKNLTASGIEISLKNSWGRLRATSNYYYYNPSIGIRHISESGLESSAEYSKISEFGSNPIQSRLEIGLIKHINKNFAIGGRFLSVKEPDWTENGIFVRRSF